jgi:hypothetical protein
VVGSFVVGGVVLGAIDQLTQQTLLPRVTYPLTLRFVVHGVAATAVVSWFHGARGKSSA